MAYTPKIITIITCILVLTVNITTASDDSNITCGTVTSRLAQCVSYLTSNGPLSSDCCVGVQSLNHMAQTTSDRRQVCECIKVAAKEIDDLSTDLIAELPASCGVSIPYPISFNTDCDNISTKV